MSDMAGYWERLAAPWLKREAEMEAMLAPVAAALDEALALRPGEGVLDVGPGSGASLLRHRAAVGNEGKVAGIDIAPPFAARSRARTGVDVHVGDAGAVVVEEAGFDAVASQFGLMFFADPAAGFATVGRNLRPGGRLVFIAWGPRAQNPLFALPGQVVAEVLGPAEPADPDAPGPFGLQNAGRAVALLGEAGLLDAVATAVGLTLPTGLDASEFAEAMLDVGPAASRLRDIDDPAVHDAVARRIAARVEAEHMVEGEVRLPAVLNLFTARRSD